MPKPLLSIGMIFKNEIRCLERCLESLRPLRDAIPCELVMADTGSDDGSREIAAKYADDLFDFPWIDDFSAARNAVMDRCSGEWYLSIDADEWLAPDIEEMVMFLTRKHKYNFFGINIRNYKSAELEAGGLYMDSAANRLMRMSTGKRFQGSIHEGWDPEGQPVVVFKDTMLYHDGYVHAQPGSREAKEERNLRMLRRELKKAPDGLGLLLQAYESSYGYSEEHLDYIRRAIRGVEEKRNEWDKCGPAIYRHGVVAAFTAELPELESWIARAEELFPDSIIIRLDVNHTALGLSWNREDYAGCVRRGEAYFQAVKDYESKNFNIRDVTASPPAFASTSWQQTARGFLAASYLYEKQPEKCVRTLKEMFEHPLDRNQTEEAVRALVRLHMLTQLDTAPLILALWERLREPVPSQEVAEERLDTFYSMGFGVFKEDFRLEEGGEVLRSAPGLFAPLEERCELGLAAAILETEDPRILEKKLARVEKWEETPLQALVHAIACGAAFPPPERPMNMEEMDALAARLAGDREVLTKLAIAAQPGSDCRAVCWRRALAMAAVQGCDWQDGERGMELARAFADAERAFLPLCYAPSALTEEGLFLLPPLHRFGWYLIQAFDALDGGDASGYVQILREGLDSHKGMKAMVEFLLDRTPVLQAPPPSAELLELAEKVRALLAAFPPDDPAVAVLKQSEAYQKVADLIEGLEPPVMGGLRQ